MELVSIIIPAYNAGKTIMNAISSLKQQTYTDIEIIIVNDGSTDDTDNKCSKMAIQDSRIKYYSIDNGGVSNARNTGIALCTGKYLAFLDADDCIQPDFVEIMVSKFNNSTDLVCSGYSVIQRNQSVRFSQVPTTGIYNSNEYYKAIEKLQDFKCLNMLWNKLFRRDVIKQFDIKMDTNLNMGEDLIFILDYIESMRGYISIISFSGYNYLLSEGGLQVTYKESDQLRLDQLLQLKKIYTNNSYPLYGYYLECVRCFYTILFCANDIKQSQKVIKRSRIYNEMILSKVKLSGKYEIFFKLLKLDHMKLIELAIKIFRSIKKACGKSYRW